MRIALVERSNRIARGNRTLIALRLLLAMLSLAVLLIQYAASLRQDEAGRVHGLPVSGEVTALRFSPDGLRLFSGGTDATIRVWDLARGTEALPPIEGHGDVICALAPHPDGRRLASASADHTVRIFDLALEAGAGRLRATLSHDAPVTVAAWSPDGNWLLTAGGDNPLRIWDPAGLAPRLTGGAETRAWVFAAFIEGGRKIVSADYSGQVRLWDSGSGAMLADLPGHIRPILAAACSPDGRWLVTGGNILRVWDLKERGCIRASEGHRQEISAIDFGAGGAFLTGGRDRRAMLWTLDQAAERAVYEAFPEAILAVALAPNGQLAAAGTRDQVIRVWRTDNGRQVQVLVGHQATLRSAYLAPGSRRSPLVPPVPLYWRPEGVIVLVVLLLTLFYLWAARREELAPKLAVLQTMVDTGLISVLVYHTAGPQSPFLPLYLISIAAAAIVLTQRGTLLVAALAALLFTVVTLAYDLGWGPQGWLPQAQLRALQDLRFIDYLSFLLLPVCAFFLVGWLAGNLSQRLAVTRLLHNEILEGIGEGVMVMDLERRVLYHNLEAVKLLRIEGKLERKALADLLGEEVDRSAVQALAQGFPARQEALRAAPGGRVRPLLIRLIPVRDADAPPRGLIVVLDDISAEKQMEEFNRHKERIMAMGQLSASIAHEIRNPLASIRGAVQEISRSASIPESKKVLVEIVLSESDRLDAIISDFLRYARMRPPTLTEVDSAVLFRDLKLLLLNRPEARDIAIVFEDPGELEHFRADVEQLRQVLLNLCVNAMQALSELPAERRPGGKVLAVRLYPVDFHRARGGDSTLPVDRLNRAGVAIEVSDNGGGIPEEVRRRLFEPFFTTKQGGTGLGLAMVARIVQGHQGLVTVREREGGGTIFTVWIPLDLRPEHEAVILESLTA